MNIEINLDELNTSSIHDCNAPDLEPLSLPMSTAPEDFINEVNVTKPFQSFKLKSSSGPDGLSNLPLKYGAKELLAVFTDLFQLSISTLRTTRFLAYYKNHTSARKVIFDRLSKNASDCMRPVYVKVFESLVVNSIDSFTI